ncbi:hypothetical protein SAMN05192584_11539 [Streptomyces pini]|uniref:Uncharacterized protein n=1 Tax=Streptomyces pini TaxID=1520580 RepID=A0A1I4G2L5_9ACTN|nr:hypothetical protein SAMN05192584_11539 [Streptomyces pini]
MRRGPGACGGRGRSGANIPDGMIYGPCRAPLPGPAIGHKSRFSVRNVRPSPSPPAVARVRLVPGCPSRGTATLSARPYRSVGQRSPLRCGGYEPEWCAGRSLLPGRPPQPDGLVRAGRAGEPGASGFRRHTEPAVLVHLRACHPGGTCVGSRAVDDVDAPGAVAGGRIALCRRGRVADRDQLVRSSSCGVELHRRRDAQSPRCRRLTGTACTIGMSAGGIGRSGPVRSAVRVRALRSAWRRAADALSAQPCRPGKGIAPEGELTLAGQHGRTAYRSPPPSSMA